MIADVLAKQMYNLTLLRSAVSAGSISRASAELGVSQPTITRGIARLEAALGYRLVERNAHGVVPTEVCQGLLRHVDLAAGQLAEAGACLRRMQRSRHRALVCGGSPAAMESYVPAVMHEVLARFPDLSLGLREAQSTDLLDMIRAGELDIAVGARLRLADDEGVTAEPLFRDTMGVFVRRGHPLLQADPQPMAALLTRERWVLPEPLWAFPKAMMSGNLQSKASRVIKAQSSSAMRWYARETDFLVVSTSLMLHAELTAGQVAMLPTDWPFPRSEHVVYYRAQGPLERPLATAVDLFKASHHRELLDPQAHAPDGGADPLPVQERA